LHPKRPTIPPPPSSEGPGRGGERQYPRNLGKENAVFKGNGDLKWMKIGEYFETIHQKNRVIGNVIKLKLQCFRKKEIIECIACTPRFVQAPWDPVTSKPECSETGHKSPPQFFCEKNTALGGEVYTRSLPLEWSPKSKQCISLFRIQPIDFLTHGHLFCTLKGKSHLPISLTRLITLGLVAILCDGNPLSAQHR